MVGADDYSHPDVNLILRSLPRWRHYYEPQLHQPLCHQQLCHQQLCHQQHCHQQLCHQQHCHQQHCHRQHCHRQHCHQQHCHQRLCRHPVGQQGMEGLHLVHEFFWWRIWVIPQFHCFFLPVCPVKYRILGQQTNTCWWCCDNWWFEACWFGFLGSLMKGIVT